MDTSNSAAIKENEEADSKEAEQCENLLEEIELCLQDDHYSEAMDLFKELNRKQNLIENFNIKLDLRAQIDMRW